MQKQLDELISNRAKRIQVSMSLAFSYNQITGASITHHDVEKWGFLETEEIFAAMKFWNT